MLKQLSIQNYALIQNLEINFNSGLSIITGETGAGKSILLGGLGLVLGNRADFSVLQEKDKKCIVEVSFNLSAYKLNNFFHKHDLDYEDETNLRREITPQGKSRAFINDTPVKLDVLRKIGEMLIDIHSQHQSLRLGESVFQLEVVDAVAGNQDLIKKYKSGFSSFSSMSKSMEVLKDKAALASTEEDFLKFQFNELEELAPVKGEQEEIEREQETLNHLEEIKKVLHESSFALSEQEGSMISQLSEIKNNLENISRHHEKSKELSERLKSAYLEIEDIASEISEENEKLNLDPERAQIIEDRLSAIYQLQQKHRVNSIEELLQIKGNIDEKLNTISSYDLEIEKLEIQLEEAKKELREIAKKLSQNRKKSFPIIKKKIEEILSSVGMPNATIEVHHKVSEEIHKNGIDELEILFSANKGSAPQAIHKVASGGEMSRLMLAIKSVLADYKHLPTIIFDEIDSGVSGDVANKMGNILKSMANNRQVISITHLAQLAAKGSDHFFVYKKIVDGKTLSIIRKLENQERVEQLATMLSGETLSQAALDNARELLDQ